MSRPSRRSLLSGVFVRLPMKKHTQHRVGRVIASSPLHKMGFVNRVQRRKPERAQKQLEQIWYAPTHNVDMIDRHTHLDDKTTDRRECVD